MDRTRFDSLDGLRCLAIVPVVWHHATPRPQVGVLGRGPLGVDLFFAISGFLITTLLLREREKQGRIALGAFYIRRTLRIFPLYYLVLGAFVLHAIFLREDGPARDHFLRSLPFHATYTTNWLVDFVISLAASIAAATLVEQPIRACGMSLASRTREAEWVEEPRFERARVVHPGRAVGAVLRQPCGAVHGHGGDRDRTGRVRARDRRGRRGSRGARARGESLRVASLLVRSLVAALPFVAAAALVALAISDEAALARMREWALPPDAPFDSVRYAIGLAMVGLFLSMFLGATLGLHVAMTSISSRRSARTSAERASTR